LTFESDSFQGGLWGKLMRQVLYGVAMSLDGYIAGPNGEADWIVMDPEIDFGAMFSRFDTLLIGRKTFAAMQSMGGGAGMAPRVRSVIISRSMQQADYPDVTIVNDAEPFVAELKSKPGKDIWLFGGGVLFHSLLGAGLVDGIDVGVIPVLLGGGFPLLPTPAPHTTLALKSHRVYEKTGIVHLEYDVLHSPRP
jgi:dihydrofolate reductase